MVAATSAGSRTAASNTGTTLAWPRALTSAATAIARRVLPMPPGPVRVSSRTASDARRLSTVSRSSVRPISDVSGSGRFGGEAGASGVSRDGSCPRAAARKSRRSPSVRCSALARRCTVCGYGRWRSPRSRAPMPLAVRPAISASSSCVRPAASRWRRRSSPNAGRRSPVIPIPGRPPRLPGTGAPLTMLWDIGYPPCQLWVLAGGLAAH